MFHTRNWVWPNQFNLQRHVTSFCYIVLYERKVEKLIQGRKQSYFCCLIISKTIELNMCNNKSGDSVLKELVQYKWKKKKYRQHNRTIGNSIPQLHMFMKESHTQYVRTSPKYNFQKYKWSSILFVVYLSVSTLYVIIYVGITKKKNIDNTIYIKIVISCCYMYILFYFNEYILILIIITINYKQNFHSILWWEWI